MGALLLWLVAALGASLCNAAPVPGSLEVVVSSPVSVRRGDTTTLPCWLNPSQSAEALEVSWYRGSYNSPVMFYRAKQFEDATQEASYAGRVSFGLKDAASGGLKAGDVSLKLDNATIEDAGDYNCYVSSEQGYDRASVRLIVTEMGTPPLLSAVWKEDNMVNLSCESEGWNPQPSLRWSHQKQVLTSKSVTHSKDSSGLWSVHSWTLVSSSTEVSCSVGISGEEAKEARVHLEKPPEPKIESGSSSAIAGWAFAVLFALLFIAMLVLYFKKRGKKAESETDHAEGKKAESETDHAEENHALLPKGVIQPIPSQFYAQVSLDDKRNEYLKIRDRKLRDAPGVFPDGDKVTCLTAIKGTPGFSSGQHYWEVSLGTTDAVGLKKSWWLGVTSAAAIPDNLDFSPTTSNGFWFLSSSPDSFQFSTEPSVLLPIRSRPQTVGVHLNYDGGELSFYNVKEESLIGTLKAEFTGDIFPLFNPGKGDRAVMEILLGKEQGQASGTGNSVDSTAQESET